MVIVKRIENIRGGISIFSNLFPDGSQNWCHALKDMLEKESVHQKADRLIAVVRQLTAELHEGRDYSLAITLDSALDRDLGLDSLARVELLSRIEHSFEVRLSEKILANSESPRDLLRAVLAAEAPGQPVSVTMEDFVVTDQVTTEASGAHTLGDMLDWHSQTHPQHLHITLYGEGDILENITFGSLRENAESVASGLQYQGIEPGQAVALMLPSSREYFFSFFGVLLAGGVPVPLYPPARPTQIEEHLRRHTGILRNSLAVILVTIPEVLPLARILKAHVETLRDVVTVEELSAHGGQLVPQLIRSADTAFLQYTSGSTGNPKGVVLSHANLLANIRAMGERIQANSKDIFVSWLPLYHDMGLIGAWLGSLYYGCQLVIMSPLSFLVHPEKWLWAIHRHRGTLSASPNFGYEFCLKKIDARDIDGLDLSSWRLAFNGAESVSPETVKNFPARFSRYGLRPEVMTPVYGLAESSVGLAFPPLGNKVIIDRIKRETFMTSGRAVPASATDEKALQFVACGKPLKGHPIRIVDANDTELPDRREGTLQFAGPSVTSGYFRNIEQTKQLFHGKWLDSGDMAYMADGDVYITGRVKDIVIRGGRNIYPSELEEIVGKINGIRKGCVAVFGSHDPESKTEQLVVIAETRKTIPEELKHLHAAINNCVTDLLGLPPDHVLLVPPQTVLKTSSGKLRRSATRVLYEEGRLGKGTRAVWWQLVRVTISGFIPQLRKGMQSLSRVLYSGYSWCLFYMVAIPVWLLVVLLPRKGWRWAVMRIASRLLAQLSRTPLVVNGCDNLKSDRPIVLVANHMSYLDGLVLVATLPLELSFVVKAELKQSLLPRLFLSRMEVEFVERFDVEQGANGARRITQTGTRGKSLFFFPEGTLQRIPGLLPFRMGAFVAAAEADMPVIPITIRGTRHMLRAGSWFIRRGVITVTIGKPIRAEGSGWTAAIALRDNAREEIMRHCGEPDLAGTRPPVRGKQPVEGKYE